MEWYDPDALTTKDGKLEIKFDKHKSHNLDYRSGMLQSWNKLCIKGGILEGNYGRDSPIVIRRLTSRTASISLPGRGDISGLWPGFWTMGNLGRPGYLSTTEGMWPYTYHDECDAGITANQSSTDGISYLPGMKLPACTCSNEDHPNPGKSRSAPEIDALEASVGPIDKDKKILVGTGSQSAQVAPFDLWYQPDYDQVAVYHPEHTLMNSYRGGFFQQAISGMTVLNNSWYDGKDYQTYGFEYEPGSEGMIEWNVGTPKTWKMTALATGPNGNIGQRPIPQEPMSIIINCGMSSSFAFVDLAQIDSMMPATMRIDWYVFPFLVVVINLLTRFCRVRVWQDEDCEDCSVTCDPPDYPTTEYIKEHKVAYDNVNLTSWKATGYEWPRNSYVNECKM